MNNHLNLACTRGQSMITLYLSIERCDDESIAQLIAMSSLIADLLLWSEISGVSFKDAMSLAVQHVHEEQQNIRSNFLELIKQLNIHR